jgi:hypothetical protein
MHHLCIAILPNWNAADCLRGGEFEQLLPDYAISGVAPTCGVSGDTLDVVACAKLSRSIDQACRALCSTPPLGSPSIVRR